MKNKKIIFVIENKKILQKVEKKKGLVIPAICKGFVCACVRACVCVTRLSILFLK